MAQKKPKERAKSKAKPKAKAKGGKSSKSAGPDISKLPDRRAMEGMIWGQFAASGRQGPLVRAQDLVYQAFDEPQIEDRVRLALEALKISQDCADAWVLLAELVPESREEALELYQKGVAAGEHALGKRAFKEDRGHFWGLLETRPYMRARQGLAQMLWMMGEREEAVGHYRDMLSLNPNDNQGIRYVLASCLMELGRDDEVAALLNEYEEDASAAWMYTRALLAFRKQGDCEVSRAALSQALEFNVHVPAYLLGKKQIPKQLPDYVGFGDINEAVCYAAGDKEAWRQTSGALDWLKVQVR